MMESEADTMLITTDRWKMSQQELASLRAANARLVMQNSKLTEYVNFGRDAMKSAMGNLVAWDTKVKQYIENMVK